MEMTTQIKAMILVSLIGVCLFVAARMATTFYKNKKGINQVLAKPNPYAVKIIIAYFVVSFVSAIAFAIDNKLSSISEIVGIFVLSLLSYAYWGGMVFIFIYIPAWSVYKVFKRYKGK